MNDESMLFGIMGFLVGVILSILIIIPVNTATNMDSFQKEAIKHNKARYVIQPDGSTGWEWIPEPEKLEPEKK